MQLKLLKEVEVELLTNKQNLLLTKEQSGCASLLRDDKVREQAVAAPGCGGADCSVCFAPSLVLHPVLFTTATLPDSPCYMMLFSFSHVAAHATIPDPSGIAFYVCSFSWPTLSRTYLHEQSSSD